MTYNKKAARKEGAFYLISSLVLMFSYFIAGENMIVLDDTAATLGNINAALARHPDAALLVGSTNESEFAMAHGMQHFIACYPNTERLLYNRSGAGYRGALTFMEDIYSNL